MKKRVILLVLLCSSVLVGCGNTVEDEKFSEMEKKLAQIEQENKSQKDKIVELEGQVKEKEKKDEEAKKEEKRQEEKKEKEEVEEKKEEEEEEEVEVEKSEKVSYNTYQNPRFGFTVKYPSFLNKGPQPANLDGLEFTDNTGKVELVASGCNNAMMTSVSDMYNEAIEGKNASYKNKGKDFYIVSWEEGTSIKYEYKKVGEGSINGFLITYPKNERGKYAPIVDEIYKGFKPGDLSESF